MTSKHAPLPGPLSSYLPPHCTPPHQDMAFTHTSGPSPPWLPHTSACQRPVSHRTLQPRRPTVVAGVWSHDKAQTQVLPQLAVCSVRPDIVSVEQLRVDRSKVVSAGAPDIARARKRLPRKTCMPTGYKWSLGEDTNASARKGLIHKNLYADRLEMSCAETHAQMVKERPM